MSDEWWVDLEEVAAMELWGDFIWFLMKSGAEFTVNFKSKEYARHKFTELENEKFPIEIMGMR